MRVSDVFMSGAEEDACGLSMTVMFPEGGGGGVRLSADDDCCCWKTTTDVLVRC